MYLLFKSIFYFYKFYVMKYIYIYIYEKRNFVKIFKLHNYNDFYINRKDFIKMNFF